MIIPKTNIRQLYHVACTIGETYVQNGKTYLDTRLSKLCTSDKINIWSKYKPVIHHFTDRPTDWWKGALLDCGISIKQHSSPNDLYNSLKNGEKQYFHNKPENNYRLGDFAGYNPAALPVLRDSPIPGIIYQSATSMTVTAIYKNGNYEDYEIPPTDIFDGLDTEWYFGLAIVRGSTVYWMTNSTAGNMSVTAPVAGYTDTVFTTGTAQVFTFISQRRKPSFNSSAEGPTKFYALPMGDIRPMSIKSSTVEGHVQGIYANGVLTYTVRIKNVTGSNEIINQCVVHVADTFGNTVYYIDKFDTGSLGPYQEWTFTKEHANENLPSSGKLVLYVNYIVKAEVNYLVTYE